MTTAAAHPVTVSLRTVQQKQVVQCFIRQRSSLSRREVEHLLRLEARPATKVLGELVALGALVCIRRGKPGTSPYTSLYRLVAAAVFLDPPSPKEKPTPPEPRAPKLDRCPTHNVRMTARGPVVAGAPLVAGCALCSFTRELVAESAAARRVLRGY